MFAVQPRWLRALATVITVLVFVGLYEVTTHDSKREDPNGDPTLGGQVTLSATAYCKGSVTAAGVAVQSGAAASDPALLPLGSIVQIDTGDARYDGMYTVLDTGPQIKGREVDIYMWSCNEALEFGRRNVRVKLLRKGWNPRALAPTEPSLWDRLVRRQAKGQTPPAMEPVQPRSATPR